MNSIIKPLAASGTLPATVTGWTVSESKPAVQHKDGTQTHSFTVISPKGNKLLVDLYTKGNEYTPHGWEATKDDTTDEGGYFSTGGLRIVNNELEDYDGVFCLPKCVCAILRALGLTVSDDCLTTTLDGKPCH